MAADRGMPNGVSTSMWQDLSLRVRARYRIEVGVALIFACGSNREQRAALQMDTRR